jgi:hypothetical protein
MEKIPKNATIKYPDAAHACVYRKYLFLHMHRYGMAMASSEGAAADEGGECYV